jgi:hypothetical protein
MNRRATAAGKQGQAGEPSKRSGDGKLEGERSEHQYEE